MDARSFRVDTGTSVQYLKGVGENRAALLAAAGIHTAEDLIYCFPYRYEDRRHPATVRTLGTTSPVTLRGRIVSASLKTSPVRQLKIFEAIFDDGTGRVMLVWFNQPWLAEQIKRGDHLLIYGQARWSRQGRLQIEGADFEKLDPQGEPDDEGHIVPVYSAVSTIPGKVMRRIVTQALHAVSSLDDPLPDDLRLRLGIPRLADAVVNLHQPAELDQAFAQRRSPAHRRLILGEFFAFQLALRLRRMAEERPRVEGRVRVDDSIRSAVREVLPFRLTHAQKRVTRQIVDDMRDPAPMYRLLQGDVGSGKTIVAVIAALVAIFNGLQVALLAPTEILVEQHVQRLRQLLGDRVAIEGLSSGMSASAKRAVLEGLESGSISFVVGTHALLEDPVRFHRLGLAIVDEQHRFGVEQRRRLFAKGDMPDILLMTATPIPRSLALVLYGDLELSVIDELPPGRQPVRTVVRGAAQLRKTLSSLGNEIRSGAQAYIVFPVIEESAKVDVTALEQGLSLVRDAMPEAKIEMLHGRMQPEQKTAVMQRFKDHQIDVLLSTTVIEVGIDVPNASTMIVVDADRFGLSQLHQLRGRVGRGARESACVLIRNETAREEAKKRLRVFAETTSGFDVAERDLEERGAGDVMGVRQAGISPFRFGDIRSDADLMEQARDEAIRWIAAAGVARAEALIRRMAPEGMRPRVVD